MCIGVLKQILYLSLMLLLFSKITNGVYLAQEITIESEKRVRSVGIITGRDLNSSSPSNIGDDGITRLSEMFVSYGATVSIVAPNVTIPLEIELVVVIGPRRPMSTSQIAYLWDFLHNGGHLLLAVDPNGHNSVSTEVARSSGLNRLLNTEYGIRLLDDFLIEDWFELDTLNNVVTSWSEARAENLMRHPITDPLVKYDLPVRFWGARSVMVDSMTGIASTNPLIYTENPYGETSRINFRDLETEQFSLNIGADTQGRLLLGGIGTNRSTGSRVAVIGDSEIFQNIYGQTRIPSNENLPLYPGTYIFTQRLISWLLGIPVSEWQPLPDGFTWLALDGLTDDWSTDIPETTDSTFDTDIPGGDIQKVRVIHNDQFLYMTIETIGIFPDDADVLLQMSNGDNLLQIILNHQNVFVTFNNDLVAPIEDAGYATLAHAEIRLPLRIVGANPMLSRVCVSSMVMQQPDCLDATIQSTLVNTIEPVPLRFASGPTVFLLNNANIRSAPNENGQILVQLPFRTPLSVFGRSEDSEWIRVRNGRYDGWVVAYLAAMNVGIESLPIVPN